MSKSVFKFFKHEFSSSLFLKFIGKMIMLDKFKSKLENF